MTDEESFSDIYKNTHAPRRAMNRTVFCFSLITFDCNFDYFWIIKDMVQFSDYISVKYIF